MNEGCKIKQLKENLKIKNKLNRLWIYKIDYFITIESPTDVIFTLAIKKDQNIITGSNINGDGITRSFYTIKWNYNNSIASRRSNYTNVKSK